MHKVLGSVWHISDERGPSIQFFNRPRYPGIDGLNVLRLRVKNHILSRCGRFFCCQFCISTDMVWTCTYRFQIQTIRRIAALYALVLVEVCLPYISGKLKAESSRTWLHRKIVHRVHTRLMIYYSFVQWLLRTLGATIFWSAIFLTIVPVYISTRQLDFRFPLVVTVSLNSGAFEPVSGDVFESYPALQGRH